MKKIKFLKLVMIILLVSSCSQDELSIEEFSLDKAEEKAIINLLETNLSIEAKSKIKIEATELKKINNSYYLVSKHSDKITTTLLKIEKGNKLFYAGISCTSTDCANNNGCIPDANGTKCTKCGLGGIGDCKKTVTSD